MGDSKTLYDKIVDKKKIKWTENRELIKTDQTAEIWNDFFFQTVQNLDIARYSNNGPFLGNGKDTTIKAMLNIEITQVL